MAVGGGNQWRPVRNGKQEMFFSGPWKWLSQEEVYVLSCREPFASPLGCEWEAGKWTILSVCVLDWSSVCLTSLIIFSIHRISWQGYWCYLSGCDGPGYLCVVPWMTFSDDKAWHADGAVVQSHIHRWCCILGACCKKKKLKKVVKMGSIKLNETRISCV